MDIPIYADFVYQLKPLFPIVLEKTRAFNPPAATKTLSRSSRSFTAAAVWYCLRGNSNYHTAALQAAVF
jgi:hypothetical protein